MRYWPGERRIIIADELRPRRLPHARPASGFTLIEIMVVIVILGVLAALVVPKVLERPDDARAIAAKSDIATIMQALKLYRLDNQRYPTGEQGLECAGRQARNSADSAELEAGRLSGAAAQGSVAEPLSVPQSRD